MSDFDPTKPCQLRDGTPVRVLCTDAPGERPIIFMYKNGLVGKRYADGRDNSSTTFQTHFDLVNVPKKTEKFLNMYTTGAGGIYDSLERAFAGHARNREGIIKLTYEDGNLLGTELVSK